MLSRVRRPTNPASDLVWRVSPAVESPELRGYPPLVARILASRGLRTKADAAAYFDSATAQLPDPLLLPDMDRAVGRLRAAITTHEPIVVYGDFDVDGISATAILVEGLAGLGARVQAFIPNRFSDGYGLNARRLVQFGADGVRLVVTADCGVTALSEISNAVDAGMDVIVLDHHEPGPELPAAVAVVDPKRADSVYPTLDLCSGALAFRLLRALYSDLGQPLEEPRYLDLAALATVCDMVPLQGENRAIVKAGLRTLAHTTRPGLGALLRAAGALEHGPDAETLGYVIGPRLNAAGRLEDAALALETLMTGDEVRAAELSERLSQLNRRRQQMVEEAVSLALSLAATEPAMASAIVVGDARISRGIVGLIAARLAEMYHRPAFVYEQAPDGCVGSARGIAGFDVVRALNEATHLLSRHGGHKAAGGFALDERNLLAFKAAIYSAADRQLAEGLPPVTIDIDAEVRLADVDRQAVAYLERFAPCGIGNPAPVLVSRGVRVLHGRAVGDGRHLMLDLRDGSRVWRSFAFGRGDALASIGKTLDIVYSVEMGSRGFGPRLRLVDWHKSTTMGA